MSRYFFHIQDDVQHIDREGIDLDGPAKAQSEAVIAAGEILKDLDGHFTRGNWNMRVLDDKGDVVSDILIAVKRLKPPV